MNKFLILFLLTFSLSGCANYFSEYRTVYRIETTTGQRYYSNSEPKFNESSEQYRVIDLDGNQYQVDKSTIYKIEKFKHKK